MFLLYFLSNKWSLKKIKAHFWVLVYGMFAKLLLLLQIYFPPINIMVNHMSYDWWFKYHLDAPSYLNGRLMARLCCNVH